MKSIPLPEKIRRKNFSEFVGQEHLVGKGGVIRILIKNLASTKSSGEGGFPSLILWGPPGSGKTTLARIIANELKREFHEFSAVNTSSKDIQKIIAGRKSIRPKTNFQGLPFKRQALQGTTLQNSP